MSLSFIFEFNKDLTIRDAQPSLVMTSSYEAVISLSGIFFYASIV